MEWEIFGISEIESKWDEWDRLNGLYYDSHPYFDSRFIQPCIKYFGSNTIKLAELKDSSGKIHGTLLLNKRLPGLWSLFTPSQLQIAPVLVNSDQIFQQLKINHL